MSDVTSNLYSINTNGDMTTLEVKTRNVTLMVFAYLLGVVWLVSGWLVAAGVITAAVNAQLIPKSLVTTEGNPSLFMIGVMIAAEIGGIVLLARMAGAKSTETMIFGKTALKAREKLYEYNSILSFGWEGPGKTVVLTSGTGLNAASQKMGIAAANELGARSFGIYILYAGKKIFLFSGLKEHEAEAVFIEAKRILAQRAVYFN